MNNEEIDIGKVLFSGFINAVSYGVGDYMKLYFLGENDSSLLFDIIYLPVFELGKYSLEVSYDKIEEKILKKLNNKKRLENKMLFISDF